MRVDNYHKKTTHMEMSDHHHYDRINLITTSETKIKLEINNFIPCCLQTVERNL